MSAANANLERLKLSGGWREAWLVVTIIWLAAVTFTLLWQYQSAEDRVRIWADVIEGTINGDPMVPISAKLLRTQLGDEAFIAEAQHAYPQVDLHQVLQRYEADTTNRWHFRFRHTLELTFVPPLLLYLVGVAVALARTRISSRPG
jgi:hypothetical protein